MSPQYLDTTDQILCDARFGPDAQEMPRHREPQCIEEQQRNDRQSVVALLQGRPASNQTTHPIL